MCSSRRTRKRERYQPGKIKKEKRNGTNLNDLRGNGVTRNRGNLEVG